MNILIVYNSALEPNSMSGVQRYFIDVVREWKRAGHRVDFLAARGAWPSFERNFPGSELVSSDNLFYFPPHRLSQTWRYLPAFAWRMLTAFWVHTPVRYDIVYACAQFIYEVGPALVLARRHRAEVVVKIHHVIAAQSRPPGFFDRLHVWSERTTARWLNRHAALILCTTRRVADDFHQIEIAMGLNPSPLLCTGNALDFEQFPYSPNIPKQFDVVILGRIHAHKGVFDAPPVWKKVRERFPDARLVIVGDGPHRDALVAEFTLLGLSPETGAVVFTGGISDQEKNRFVSAARMGLSLSREEGWGLSITEFMAWGLPVVAMDLPVFAEVFQDRLDLVPLGDINAAADRICFWLENPDLAGSNGELNRAFIQRYDCKKLAQVELEAMENALVRHRQSHRQQ